MGLTPGAVNWDCRESTVIIRPIEATAHSESSKVGSRQLSFLGALEETRHIPDVSSVEIV